MTEQNEIAGRGDWIRTNDPLHPMQVRYQAAPRPDLFNYVIVLMDYVYSLQEDIKMQ